MIKKEQLIKSIDRLAEQENSLVPLLNRHVSSTLSFSGLDEKDHQEILDYFQNMVIKQQEHIDVLNGIKKDVLEGAADVY